MANETIGGLRREDRGGRERGTDGFENGNVIKIDTNKRKLRSQIKKFGYKL